MLMRKTLMTALMMLIATVVWGTQARADTSAGSDGGYAVVDPYANYRKHPVTDRTRYVATRARAVRSRVVYTNSSPRYGGAAYSGYGDSTNARVVRNPMYAAPVVTYVETDSDDGVLGTVNDGVEDRVVVVQPYDGGVPYAGYNGTRSYGARGYYGGGYYGGGYYGGGYGPGYGYPTYRSPVYISFGYSYGHGYSRGGYGYYGRGHGYGYGGHGYGGGGYGGHGYGGGGYGSGGGHGGGYGGGHGGGRGSH
jgi:hypothetical protein